MSDTELLQGPVTGVSRPSLHSSVFPLNQPLAVTVSSSALISASHNTEEQSSNKPRSAMLARKLSRPALLWRLTLVK